LGSQLKGPGGQSFGKNLDSCLGGGEVQVWYQYLQKVRAGTVRRGGGKRFHLREIHYFVVGWEEVSRVGQWAKREGLRHWVEGSMSMSIVIWGQFLNEGSEGGV